MAVCIAKFALTLALSQRAREQEFRLPSPWGEGLGMRANHTCIQQRPGAGLQSWSFATSRVQLLLDNPLAQVWTGLKQIGVRVEKPIACARIAS
jgi:hypothetical protein